MRCCDASKVVTLTQSSPPPLPNEDWLLYLKEYASILIVISNCASSNEMGDKDGVKEAELARIYCNDTKAFDTHTTRL
jgi:hypothetical protein